jgi:hypothetical protein
MSHRRRLKGWHAIGDTLLLRQWRWSLVGEHRLEGWLWWGTLHRRGTDRSWNSIWLLTGSRHGERGLHLALNGWYPVRQKSRLLPGHAIHKSIYRDLGLHSLLGLPLRGLLRLMLHRTPTFNIHV